MNIKTVDEITFVYCSVVVLFIICCFIFWFVLRYRVNVNIINQFMLMYSNLSTLSYTWGCNQHVFETAKQSNNRQKSNNNNKHCKYCNPNAIYHIRMPSILFYLYSTTKTLCSGFPINIQIYKGYKFIDTTHIQIWINRNSISILYKINVHHMQIQFWPYKCTFER